MQLQIEQIKWSCSRAIRGAIFILISLPPPPPALVDVTTNDNNS